MNNSTIKSWAEIDDDSENETGKTLQASSGEKITTKGNKGKFKPESRDNSRSRKRVKYHSNSDSDSVKSNQPPRQPLEIETDAAVLQRRQKQIDYGKNTVGYYNYMQQVSIDMRSKDHPRTPDKYAKYSRRSWDTLIKMWRKKLHEYDINHVDNTADIDQELDSDDSCTK